MRCPSRTARCILRHQIAKRYAHIATIETYCCYKSWAKNGGVYTTLPSLCRASRRPHNVNTSDASLRYKHEEVGKSPDRPYRTHPDRVTLESLVACGDTLYIPRGFVHEGIASDDASMHITVALQTSDWDYVHVISHAVERYLQGHFPARACPFVGSGKASADVLDTTPLDEEKFGSLCQEALGHLSLTHAASFFKERILALRAQRDDEAGINVSLGCNSPIHLHTRMVWNCDVQMELQEHMKCDSESEHTEDIEGVIICRFLRISSGQHALLSVSFQVARILSRAFSLSQPFTISSIDASSDMLRLCVAKIMLRNGYCILADDLSS